MPVAFGSGEIAARARRLMDVRGKVSFQLDETVAPVVILGDGSRSPFRQNVRHWCARIPVTAAVGNFSAVFLTNSSDRDFLLKALSADSTVALEVQIGAAPAIPGTATELFQVQLTTEGIDARTAPPVKAVSEVRCWRDNASAANPFGTLNSFLGLRTLAGDSKRLENLDLVVPGRGGILCFVPSATNVSWTCSLEGEVYQYIPSLVSP